MKFVLLGLALLLIPVAIWYRHFDYSLINGCGFNQETELLLTSSRIVTPNGVINGTSISLFFASFLTLLQVHIENGIIEDIYSSKQGNKRSGVRVIDYGDLVIAPGIIDSHVHFFEPGFDEREGIGKGTKAASAGGITTVIDYPMSCSPPITNCKILKSKIFRFLNEARIHIAPIGGIDPENAGNREVLRCMVEVGVLGFHAILSPDRSNLTPINLTHVETTITIMKSLGVPFSIQAQTGDIPWTPKNEMEAIRSIVTILEAAKAIPHKAGFGIHFTNVISPNSHAYIKVVKESGLPVSGEVTGHSLYFTARNDENPYLKAYPPINIDATRLALVDRVRRGEVDLIASDHSPATPEEKLCSYEEALPGISGIQYLLPAVWTSTFNGSPDLHILFQMLSTRPAEVFKLLHRTGAIKKGLDADLVVWDPESIADTSLKGSYSEVPSVSPYLHTWLKGSVKETWIKGNLIYSKNIGHSWISCPTIYGLGDWAKIVILWFYEVSFAS